MTEFATPEGLEHVNYYKSPRNNRVVAIHIRAEFNEFEKFPPFMETDAEREHIRKSYNIDPESSALTRRISQTIPGRSKLSC
jgi:hypothetical protein